MKKYCIRLKELGEDDDELKQLIAKFLKDQDKTPKTDTPTSLKIQQTEGDVTSLNVDDSSFTIIIDCPCFDIAPIQANVSADQHGGLLIFQKLTICPF